MKDNRVGSVLKAQTVQHARPLPALFVELRQRGRVPVGVAPVVGSSPAHNVPAPLKWADSRDSAAPQRRPAQSGRSSQNRPGSGAAVDKLSVWGSNFDCRELYYTRMEIIRTYSALSSVVPWGQTRARRDGFFLCGGKLAHYFKLLTHFSQLL